MNYADIGDEAVALAEHHLNVALANRPVANMPFTGACYWCEESIDKGHYCDGDCRHDHETYLRAQQQRRVS